MERCSALRASSLARARDRRRLMLRRPTWTATPPKTVELALYDRREFESKRRTIGIGRRFSNRVLGLVVTELNPLLDPSDLHVHRNALALINYRQAAFAESASAVALNGARLWERRAACHRCVSQKLEAISKSQRRKSPRVAAVQNASALQTQLTLYY